jgi:hypothetical protein
MQTGTAELYAPRPRSAAERQAQVDEAKRKYQGTQAISKAACAHGPDGSLRCPRCGGSQFKAKRSKGAKTTLTVSWGVACSPSGS